jgi:hypothetical protein
MAKRKYSKMNNIQPAVQKFFFDFTTTGVQDIYHIDLSQCASLMNRRFYRQGINWAVAGFKLHTAAPGTLSINKLPNSWVMSNAWEKAFRAWQKMNREALAEAPSLKPKFLDFKIFADQFHHQIGIAGNLLPHSSNRLTGFGTNTATRAEWESSKINHPLATGAAEGATVQSELIAVGASYPGAGASGLNAVSLIEGYAASRGLPNVLDPNTPADAADVENVTPENWIGAMFNEGTGVDRDVILDMTTENNIAPYPFENDGTSTDTMYPGGANQLPTLEVHSFDIVTTSTIGGQTFVPGGNFPCGLIQILTESFAVGTDLILEVDLIPGDHRGYLCEPMTEM